MDVAEVSNKAFRQLHGMTKLGYPTSLTGFVNERVGQLITYIVYSIL